MRNNHVLSQYIAEFIGTFFMVFFGCGSMILAQVDPSYNGGFVPIVWGAVVSIMIYSVGHISGAHFNPVVTISFWLTKRFPFKRLVGYLIFQMWGAISASVIHFIIWGNAHSFGETAITVSVGAAVLVEVILSFILMFVIMSVATDSRAVGELAGIAIGSTVGLCAFVGGPLTNASMNPARSIAPAILTGNYSVLWIYLIAPLVGAVLGAFTYDWIRCQSVEAESDGPGCC